MNIYNSSSRYTNFGHPLPLSERSAGKQLRLSELDRERFISFQKIQAFQENDFIESSTMHVNQTMSGLGQVAMTAYNLVLALAIKGEFGDQPGTITDLDLSTHKYDHYIAVAMVAFDSKKDQSVLSHHDRQFILRAKSERLKLEKMSDYSEALDDAINLVPLIPRYGYVSKYLKAVRTLQKRWGYESDYSITMKEIKEAFENNVIDPEAIPHLVELELDVEIQKKLVKAHHAYVGSPKQVVILRL
jgi:hypothetical protein